MCNDDEIISLERQLSHLAMKWRASHYENAEKIISEYHEVLSKLWNLDWKGENLLPDSELPDRLMPQYFLEFWRNKKE